MIHARKIAIAGASAILAISSMTGATLASSHREAPLIAGDPRADITDLYAFVSPDKPNKVTLIANFVPFQEPGGGPNFYSFGDDVEYFIYIDNNGDGVQDVEYDFDFETQIANPDSFLYSGYGPIPAVPSNVTQTYSVSRNGVELAADLSVPPPSIGPRTTPNYKGLVNDSIHQLGDGRTVFAGQREDPFFVDLGSIFDLGGLRPFNPAHLIPLPQEDGQDTLSGINVNSIAIQVSKSDLTNDGMDVSGPDAENAVVGIWAGAMRDGVQVSRLGNPLINEVIIPLGEKDLWNSLPPATDDMFEDRYLNSELAAIINTVYPSLPDIDTTGRTDLVLILGQGVPGLNATNSGDTLYDMLRLNMGIPPTLGEPERLGVLKADLAGFPNGRRLFDDIVDIEIRAIAQGYGKFLNEAFGLPNKKPNNKLGDSCRWNDRANLQEFPYVAMPFNGYRGGEYRVAPCESHGSGPNNDIPGRSSTEASTVLLAGRFVDARLAFMGGRVI